MPAKWYAKLFQVSTGAVICPLPILDTPMPPWTQQINDPGSWSVITPVGRRGGLSREKLESLLIEGRNGVAVCYGTGTADDYIAQAGPIWDHNGLRESDAAFQADGQGMWSVLNARLQIPSTWDPSMGVADSRSIATYTGSYHDIAAQIISNQIARGSLPIDVPMLTGGTQSETYNGYEFTSAGQNLAELTQQDGGPDIYFRPYFADARHIRWESVIGNPTITNAGDPLLFDFRSNLVSALPKSSGTNLAVTSYVKGNGTQGSILWSFASDDSLLDDGYPLLESIDTNHSNEEVQANLDGYAKANQALNSTPQKTRDITVRVDGRNPVGSYGPGITAAYAFSGHPLIADGRDMHRVLGLTNGSNAGEIKHIVQV